PIKEAFIQLRRELQTLREEVEILGKALLKLYESPLQAPNLSQNQRMLPSQHTNTPTHQQESFLFSEENSENQRFSTGNEGVPTHQHTNTPTHQHTHNSEERANHHSPFQPQ